MERGRNTLPRAIPEGAETDRSRGLPGKNNFFCKKCLHFITSSCIMNKCSRSGAQSV